MSERKNVSMDADEHKRLKLWCAEKEVNLQDVVTSAVREYLNRRQAKK
jgi:hypothetical protein